MHYNLQTENREKVKKRRMLFTKEQLQVLEACFKRQSYISTSEREILASKLNLSSLQIKIWFQNHRYKCKKSFFHKFLLQKQVLMYLSSFPSKVTYLPFAKHQYHF